MNGQVILFALIAWVIWRIAKRHHRPAFRVSRYERKSIPIKDRISVYQASLGADGLLRCVYCRRPSGSAIIGPDGHKWEVDHVKPVAHGGLSVLGNEVLACRTCNRRKGAKYA